MKMTLISPEAARRRSLCDRLEAAFMQEIALLKVSRAEAATAHRNLFAAWHHGPWAAFRQILGTSDGPG